MHARMPPGFCSSKTSRNTLMRFPIAQKPSKPSIQSSWSLIFNSIRRSAVWQAIEKQFDLPAILVDRGDGGGTEAVMVAEEHEDAARVLADRLDTTQQMRTLMLR